MARIAFPPVSSHMLPKSSTPIRFCSMGSCTPCRALKVSCKAFFAASPPSPNAIFVASTSIPRSLNAVSAVPSLARIENSFMASPSLSMSKTPASAPLCSILNMSVADSPICENLGPYSLMLSRRLSFLFSPFWAPATIRSNAWEPSMPN